ncbi:uncharacterized protein CCR75_000621 [Bremia lactucae]|uniref:Uncharacterized protein n=1 Tax=Bremia lactucae TaxID=4779 RepID=A0A976FDL9_BRELC|nr:hypothetical protein CCR75_000621 [Bremia lactucae]
MHGIMLSQLVDSALLVAKAASNDFAKGWAVWTSQKSSQSPLTNQELGMGKSVTYFCLIL